MTDVPYFPPMFDRLQSRTDWQGGRLAHTDVLTLKDAAKFASQHAGAEVTQGDFLRAAARGEIALRAIVHRNAKVRRHDGGVYCNAGTESENIVPAYSIPTLPLSACQQLANTARASWRTFDGFELLDGVLMRYTKAELTNDEPNFETTPDDCLITVNHVHALADEFIAPQTEQAQTNTPRADKPEQDDATQMQGKLVSCQQDQVNEREGLTKRERQIQAIEEMVRKKGIQPLQIPTGMKAELRRACKAEHPGLFGGGDHPFNDAWKQASPHRLCMADRKKFAGG